MCWAGLSGLCSLSSRGCICYWPVSGLARPGLASPWRCGAAEATPPPARHRPASPGVIHCTALPRPQPRLPASNLGGCWSWASLGTMLASAAQWLCPHRGEDAQCRAAARGQAWAGSCPLGPAQLCPAPAPVNY